jgi:hypothetical protein
MQLLANVPLTLPADCCHLSVIQSWIKLRFALEISYLTGKLSPLDSENKELTERREEIVGKGNNPQIPKSYILNQNVRLVDEVCIKRNTSRSSLAKINGSGKWWREREVIAPRWLKVRFVVTVLMARALNFMLGNRQTGVKINS